MKPSPIHNCTAAFVVRKCLDVPGIDIDMLNGTIYRPESVYAIRDSNTTLDFCKQFIEKLPRQPPKNEPYD